MPIWWRILFSQHQTSKDLDPSHVPGFTGVQSVLHSLHGNLGYMMKYLGNFGKRGVNALLHVVYLILGKFVFSLTFGSLLTMK